MWLCLKRSMAPNSDGLRAWLTALPGVDGPLDGDEAIDDVDVAGEGGFVNVGGLPLVLLSRAVTTLAGARFRVDVLRLRECETALESESV